MSNVFQRFFVDFSIRLEGNRRGIRRSEDVEGVIIGIWSRIGGSCKLANFCEMIKCLLLNLLLDLWSSLCLP